MFTHGAPRFISPNPPPYESDSTSSLEQYASLPDASAHQLSLFLSTVSPQLSTSTLRSFLRLYTTLGTDKLAGFLGVGEEEVLEMLMTAKGAARKFTWQSGSLLEGETVGVSDINFGIDEVSSPIVAFSRRTRPLTASVRSPRVTSPSLNRPPPAATVTSSSDTVSSSPTSPTTSRRSLCRFPSLATALPTVSQHRLRLVEQALTSRRVTRVARLHGGQRPRELSGYSQSSRKRGAPRQGTK